MAKAIRKCSIDGCGKPHKARGRCGSHYKQWLKTAKTSEIRKSYSSPEESFNARLQKSGDCILWTGSTNQKGYGQLVVNGKLVTVHRYAWERKNGPIPSGKFLDHICWNKNCVNIAHLRLSNVSQNSAYRQSAQANSKSGVRNVYALPSGNWRVEIQKNSKTLHYGVYSTIEEAAEVAKQARQELFGEFAGRG